MTIYKNNTIVLIKNFNKEPYESYYFNTMHPFEQLWLDQF